MLLNELCDGVRIRFVVVHHYQVVTNSWEGTHNKHYIRLYSLRQQCTILTSMSTNQANDTNQADGISQNNDTSQVTGGSQANGGSHANGEGVRSMEQVRAMGEVNQM